MAEKKQIEIDAVDTGQLKSLLDILNIKSGFESGEYHCELCGTVITYENTKFIFPRPNMTVGFVCKNAACVLDFALKEESDKEREVKTE
ncbi:MAG: hypothetical protein H8E40_13750 [Chloroflexi bacterium]|nr:hypothetical protein [Chloroflexota bacterium]MBL7062072.1 hypothetical protein [Dehalococcoidia bacterium]